MFLFTQKGIKWNRFSGNVWPDHKINVEKKAGIKFILTEKVFMDLY